MKPQLPAEIRAWIVCPLCKADPVWGSNDCRCAACGRTFAPLPNGVWDFMVTYPPFLGFVTGAWQEGQQAYEEYTQSWSARDRANRYAQEIDSVRELYTQHFPLDGRILDVGGHQGRLRHFLPPTATHVAIDPCGQLFDNLHQQPNLLQAYACLRQPCNFVRGQAEKLPFRNGCFDVVHMRSVLDHFADPLIALAEARRVLRPGGRLLIGTAVRQSDQDDRSYAAGLRSRPAARGVRGMLRAATARLHRRPRAAADSHIWHPSASELNCLVTASHFAIEKSCTQKPPNEQCVYLLAAKR